MMFNYVLMNPPYKATLHLDVISAILEPKIKCGYLCKLITYSLVTRPLI